MGHKILHTVFIHNDELMDAGEDVQRNVASAGTLTDGPAAVESLSLDPNERQLTAQLRGETATRRVETIEQLFEGQGIDEIAFWDPNGSGEDGYYTLDSSSLETLDPRADGVEGFTGTLTKKGTKNSYYRAQQIGERQLEHEFGNDTDALVAVSEVATKIRWYNSELELDDPAESVERQQSEYVDVLFFDTDDAPWDREESLYLIYELDYDQEGRIEVVTWDDRGLEPFDEDGVPQWQRVYRFDHDFDGQAIIENGLVRLYLDEDAGTIAAERWGAKAPTSIEESGQWNDGLWGAGLWGGTRGGWATIALEQPETAELYDVDITRVSMARDVLQLTFDVDGSLFALNAIVAAGQDDVLFDIPDGEDGPIPQPIEEWLEPVASESVIDTQASKTLVSRSEVQR